MQVIGDRVEYVGNQPTGYQRNRIINEYLTTFFILGDFDDCDITKGNAQDVLAGQQHTTLSTVTELISYYIKTKMLWLGTQENIIRAQQGRPLTLRYLRADNHIRDTFGQYFADAEIDINSFTHYELHTLIKSMMVPVPV